MHISETVSPDSDYVLDVDTYVNMTSRHRRLPSSASLALLSDDETSEQLASTCSKHNIGAALEREAEQTHLIPLNTY